jgi:hypothetical protein
MYIKDQMDTLQGRIKSFSGSGDYEVFDDEFFKMQNDYLKNHSGADSCRFYVDKENGISQVSGDTMSDFCNVFFIPVMDMVVHYLDRSERLLQIAAYHNEKWHKILITPKSLRKNPDWLRNSLGFRANYCCNYDKLVKYIDILCPNITTVHQMGYIGWSKEHAGVYITGSGVIGNSKRNNIQPHESLSHYALKQPGIDRASSIHAMMELFLEISDHKFSYPAISFALLSCYKSLLDETPHKPEFVLYIHGKTGSRKTSVSKVIFNIFDEWEGIPTNFTSTGPAMELTRMERRDTVTLIDDVPPTFNAQERRNLLMKVEGIFRSTGDSVGRQKMYSNTRKIEMRPQGMAVITAEEDVIQSVSSKARGFLLPINEKTINLEKLTLAQRNHEKYSAAIYHYIEYISQDSVQFIERVEHLFRKYERIFMQAHPKAHGRQIHSAAWLQTSFHMFLRYAKRNQAIEEDQFNLMKDENKAILSERIQEMVRDAESNNEVEMFVTALKELLATKSIFLLDIELKDKRKVVPVFNKDMKPIGYRDNNYLYLLPDSIYNSICSYYSKRQMLFPVKDKTLWGYLCDSKLLVPGKSQDGTRTIRVSVNGNRISVIRIDRELFEAWGEELYSIDSQELLGSLPGRLKYS